MKDSRYNHKQEGPRKPGGQALSMATCGLKNWEGGLAFDGEHRPQAHDALGDVGILDALYN